MKKAALMALSIYLLGSLISISCGSGESADTPHSGQAAAVARNSTGDASVSQAVAFNSAAVDTQGARRPMSEWVGKQPTVVNFWGTWCPPCRREIPELVRLYNEYSPKGVEIVSLAVRDSPSKVTNYASQAGMNWVMLLATEDVANEFGYSGGVPTTIFYDKQGNEKARFVGARNYDTFKKAFEEILADG